MAFNFRPKTTDEIIDAGKAFSLQAASIYSFIKKKYKTTIILDPTKDFSQIKIPRVVEEQINIKDLKNKLDEIVNATKLSITFGNGSGPKTGGTDAVETAKQENCTRLACEMFIEENKMPTSQQFQKIYKGYDDEWAQTFKLQAESVKDYLKGKRGYEYSRDDGIMPIIETFAKRYCGVNQMNNWTPADIYLVKKNELNKIKKKLEQISKIPGMPAVRLDSLNEFMVDQFKSKKLIGISLKKITGNKVKLEETNVGKGRVEKINLVKNSFKCDLDIDSKGEFNTGELAFAITVDGSEGFRLPSVVNVQIRAFSGGVRESTQMDMTGSGAAAKLGKVSSQKAIDPYLSKVGLKRRMGTNIPKVGKFTTKEVKDYEEEQKQLAKVSINGSSIYFGKVPWPRSFLLARDQELVNNRTASQLSSKLQCFQWIKIFDTITKRGKLDEFLSVLYYGAKKEYESAGPFLKIG
jgi:tetrahydromethanopterin S-methyltransferase subunit G|tara:strand:- start:75 stop:1469 length:1395 start_codon:yes stop_codon:yes gene_type:complete